MLSFIFLIINNDSAPENIDEANDYASEIDAENELNMHVNDGTDNCERHHQLINCILENVTVYCVSIFRSDVVVYQNSELR